MPSNEEVKRERGRSVTNTESVCVKASETLCQSDLDQLSSSRNSLHSSSRYLAKLSGPVRQLRPQRATQRPRRATHRLAPRLARLTRPSGQRHCFAPESSNKH